MTPTYYHQDALGSVIALTDASGAIIRSTGYEPFGGLRGTSGVTSPWGFTGRLRDAESGLVFLRNRYYDSLSGRFLTQDPIGAAGGMNLYAYVRNNPLNLLDPFGYCELGRCGNTLTTISIIQRGLAALAGFYARTDASFGNAFSFVQGIGLLAATNTIAFEPIGSVSGGRLDVTQAQAVVAIRGIETIINVGFAGIGVSFGSPAGPGGAVAGAVALGTGSALVTRRAGNWVLQSFLGVPIE